MNRRLCAAIGALPGVDPDGGFEILQCSSQTATGAIIWHIASRRGTVRAIVKTPRDPASDHAIAAEWENVVQLHGERDLESLIPAPLGRFQIDGATFYAYAAIAGRTMFSQFRNRIVRSRDGLRAQFARQALPVALRLHASRSLLVDGSALARELTTELEFLRRLVQRIPQKLEQRVAAAADDLSESGLQMPKGRIHGDFSPYNLMTKSSADSGCTGIIDWEHSESDRPQYLDIFRFIGGAVLMGRRAYGGAAALRRMADPVHPAAVSLWEPWLAAMVPAIRVSPGSKAYAALWIHFWINAAYREQSRESDPANISQTTYFRSLCEFA